MKDSYERIIKNIIDEKLIVIVPNQKSNETNFQAIKYVYEENTKLKAEIEALRNELKWIYEKRDLALAEIEQLKRLSDQQSELNIEQFKQIDNQYQEIEQLNGIISRDIDKHECYVISKSIEVNNLKIEIEQLKAELEQWQSTNLKLVCELTRIECENNQLKSELEQSVKLPCKCDNCVYADFMYGNSERFYCMEHNRYMVVGGYCSFGKAEQSLKGGAD